MYRLKACATKYRQHYHQNRQYKNRLPFHFVTPSKSAKKRIQRHYNIFLLRFKAKPNLCNPCNPWLLKIKNSLRFSVASVAILYFLLFCAPSASLRACFLWLNKFVPIRGKFPCVKLLQRFVSILYIYG